MDFLAIFRAPGWIFGPPAMLCAIIALVMCILATVWWSPTGARRAMISALAPLAIAQLGVAAGSVYIAVVSNPAALAGGEAQTAIGNTVAFGVVMSALPALWAALLLLRHGRAMP